MSSAYLEILINRYLPSIRDRLRGMLAMYRRGRIHGIISSNGENHVFDEIAEFRIRNYIF